MLRWNLEDNMEESYLILGLIGIFSLISAFLILLFTNTFAIIGNFFIPAFPIVFLGIGIMSAGFLFRKGWNLFE